MLESLVAEAYLQHHADKVIHGDIYTVNLANEGQEFLTKLKGRLAFFLAGFKELFPSDM